MKKLTTLLNFNTDDDLFKYIISTLKTKGITQWNYFVNWDKVHNNIKPHEVELNILNVLIGKENIKEELTKLILQYPKVVNTIPVLLAIRFKKKSEQKINIVSDIKSFKYDYFDLSIKRPNYEEAENIASFFIGSGLGSLVKDEKVKNLVDYATGVEVGLD